jgi:organic hydroperoxide reductase OsmC/OhrA
MSEHHAHIFWKRNTQDFLYETYDRTHEIKFEGGQRISGSSAPEFKGKVEFANPEEMLAASASTCHMLTFLALCSKKRIVVNSYDDNATAMLDKNTSGKLAVTKIILRPKVTFEGAAPDSSTLHSLHERSHQECFIANSIKCEVVVE